ncbi:MAG: beta-galactosidase trimerization domain-containing protein [Candidatus Omnitrophica bacterium]|nr:beta-galactosidase trimerization domain-containing protein [Candidatus Omnitrophota bacterium]
MERNKMLRNVLKIFVLIIILLFKTSYGNIFPIGGFEKNVEYQWKWNIYPSDTKMEFSIIEDEKEAREGKCYAKLCNPDYDTVGTIFSFFNVEPFYEYELSFYFKDLNILPDLSNLKIILNFNKKNGANGSAGRKIIFLDKYEKAENGWKKYKGNFVTPPESFLCHFVIRLEDLKGTLLLDKIEIVKKGKYENSVNKYQPYKIYRKKFNIQDVLTQENGNFRVSSWYLGGIYPDKNLEKKYSQEEWKKIQLEILNEMGENGLYGPSLPWAFERFNWIGGKDFFKNLYDKYEMKLWVYTENSYIAELAAKKGAELLIKNVPPIRAVSELDPIYVEAVLEMVKKYAEDYKDLEFVDFYKGRDEPFNNILKQFSLVKNPNSKFLKEVDKEIKELYGFGRYGLPDIFSKEYYKNKFENKFKWIAFGRWVTDKFISQRIEIDKTLHSILPKVNYEPCNFNFILGIDFIDFSAFRNTGIDWLACDPYASYIEEFNYRGTYNHGFGTKLLKDLSGCKNIKTIVQAFPYGGYTPDSEDIIEWVSQSIKNGAIGIEFYDSGRPKFYQPDIYSSMLKVGSVLKRMKKIKFPIADTAILYSYYSHVAEGPRTNANEVYTAYSILGEKVGSWFDFISDTMIEKGYINLSKYKVIYIPRFEITTEKIFGILDDYVKNGGCIVLTDPEALSFDIKGKELKEFKEKWFGSFKLEKGKEKFDTLGRGIYLIINGKKYPIFMRYLLYGQRESNIFYLKNIGDDDIIAKYENGRIAGLKRKYGKGFLYIWGCNIFVSDAINEPLWINYWKEFQKKMGCNIELPIWDFTLKYLIN